jgi:tetratricopeptide (TPR) repeat protein
MQRQKGVDVALDYYLQGVRIDPCHYPCVLNLACVYSQLDKHANASKWFDLARKVNPLSIDAYYGTALSCFKMKQFQQAYNTLDGMPSEAESETLRPEDLTYFKALCLKKLYKFKEAEREYKTLGKQFSLTEGNKLIKYIFGVIILPLQRERKVSFISIAHSFSQNRSLKTILRIC